MISNASAPKVHTALLRVVNIFKRVGTEAQQSEAEELEKYLEGFRAQPAEAVNFAREEPAGTIPEGKK